MAETCPSIWCTPTNGLFVAKLIALASATPTNNAPTSPGPYVTAIASISFKVTSASSSAASITWFIFSICFREAISGTTPPYNLCNSICEEITFDNTILPFFTTAAAVSSQDDSIPNIKVSGGLIGKVVNLGINDVNNMGAVMAPACADTIYTYLQNAHETVKDYDLILTGDLGKVGLNILKEYYEKVYNERLNKIMDAGDEIFLETSQYSGGSGPVCLPLVFLTKILKNKKYKKILIVGSGSLHNPTLVNQGKEIPAISHLVKIEVLL